MLKTVRVPERLAPLFEKAEEYVSRYFAEKAEDPSKGTIEVFGQRYILVRAASMSVDFFETIRDLFAERGDQEAIDIARSLLFDIAHAIGKMDARNFHKRMNVQDPIEKLSAGPIHFSYSGWAYVDILPESKPSPDENYYLIYDHPFSFESDAWIQSGRKPVFPVCVMNAGYSSGWCEESFGVPLAASEILCKARGDKTCRFIMAHPTKIEQHVREHSEKAPETVAKIEEYRIPEFFERVRSQEALRESEERFRVISAYAQDAIIMMDSQGRISLWNPAAEKIFGWTSGEVVGRVLHQILTPEKYRAAYEKGLDQFWRTGQGAAVGKTLELSALRKDGIEFPIEISLAGVKLRGQWHAVGIVRDVTSRKQREEELVAARETALAAARAKSEFLANMSHEIRTPMNGVIGMNGLLLDTELTAEQRQYAEAVGSSANALLSVINDILDFSKIEAGKLDLEMLDFDLRAMLDDMGDVLAVKPQEKGLEYACVIEPEVPSLLRGDPGRLRQVLTNLIGNAVKFTEAGEVVLHVAPAKETDTGVEIRFAVTDTGIGIPKDKMAALFEPFTQADASITRKYGGTGLGLAISKQIVEIMAGNIGAESEVGKGSTFWFTAVFGRQAGAPPPPRQYPGDVRGARVLVVDDNAINRLVLEKQLLSWGCRHAEAPDGYTALARLRAAAAEGDPFRVAILDMQMPGMDGETLGRTVKEDELLRDVLLVMMTSVGKRGDAARLREVGFSAYLTKPVKQAQFHDCLATLLGETAAPETPQVKPIVTRYTIEEEKRRKVRILLAEDNPTNQIVALRTLEKAGYRADAVANGAEVLAALEHLPYDLVLMDVQMPEMDGFEATRRIRDRVSRVQDHEIPIIAMTAHAMKGDREKCIAAGMDDYVSKPVNPRELIEAIERHLRGAGRAKAASVAGPAAAESRVFDRDALLERAEGDEDLLQAVIQVFLEDAPRQIAVLKEAVAAKDASMLRRQAHCLKSASGSAGAISMQEAALQIETASESGDVEKAASVVRRVEEEFEKLKRLLASQ